MLHIKIGKNNFVLLQAWKTQRIAAKGLTLHQLWYSYLISRTVIYSSGP